ncbi:MAG: hypothetical protein H0T42_27210 [Deltaproteobacteria bacterium]|nr:hypothetical protein [Deltaproteobacteria bacterium]
MKRWLGRVKLRDGLGTWIAESREYEIETADDADDTHACIELQDQWAAEGKPLIDGEAFVDDVTIEVILDVMPVGHPGGLIN